MARPTHPPAERVRLFLADVDGSLVDEDKQLTQRAKAAVRRLHDAGIAFAITSGRPPRGMEMLIEPLALDQPIAGFNGGVMVNPDLSVIDTKLLGAAVAKRAVDCIEAAGLDAWIYSGTEWFLRDPDAPHVDREAHTVAFGPTVIAEFDELYDQAVKVVGVSDDLERVAQCEAATRKTLGDSAEAARSQPYYLDVTNPKANKGEVVATLAKHLKIDPAEIAVIGDMPNDVNMFKCAGLSIAMGNASAEVKEQAHFTTGSNAEDGFAEAVEKYILSRKP